ncbi:MAG: hypothetical protein ACI9U6_000095 [Loktanella salsilacus]|jgi:hypothetical protein|uniref:GSCFA domain-containing protein n=1 Tax=Loktanella salsilacus TaxID=195913 RepID=UPI0039892864
MPDQINIVPCPYKSLPDSAYWRRAVGDVPPQDIDPVTKPGFELTKTTRIATAGSCFAQHIARHLRNSGGTYLVTEPGHPMLNDNTRQEFNYGTFTARFGNIYTTRQLRQLMSRAYGSIRASDDIWEEDNGSFIDPFRPFIQPGGFKSRAEFDADRQQHYAAVREMVETADVFVFTMGLTEAWENTTDGMVYAACPGCGAGKHVEGESRFRNFKVTEVYQDLAAAIAFMREKNPNLYVLLTVSPVPLIATYSEKHVLAATTYSKSVLRVAAEMMTESHDYVDYFPSYEIITSAFNRGAYYDAGLRDVEEIGVRHAMTVFFKNYCTDMALQHYEVQRNILPPALKNPAKASASDRANKVVCDEERLGD